MSVCSSAVHQRKIRRSLNPSNPLDPFQSSFLVCCSAAFVVLEGHVTFELMTFPFPLDVQLPLYLAPMAGVSESPFRRLCRRFGADVVVTEFLSAEAIRRENFFSFF